MKEFNLELAKAGHPVQTRDGRKARIICWDKKGNNYPIVALITTTDDTEEYSVFTAEGRFHTNGCCESLDLVMAPEKHEGWVNLYRGESGYVNVGILMNSEQEAKNNVNRPCDSYVATAKVEWEE